MGRGNNIFIGLDPIMGMDQWFISRTLLAHLHHKNMVILKMVYEVGADSEPGWLSLNVLGLTDDVAREWKEYTSCS